MLVPKSDQDKTQFRGDGCKTNRVTAKPVQMWALASTIGSGMPTCWKCKGQVSVGFSKQRKEKRCVQRSRKKIRTLKRGTLITTKTFKMKYQGRKEFYYIQVKGEYSNSTENSRRTETS